MLRHQLAFISFLFTLWLFPAALHAHGKFTGGAVTADAGGAGDFVLLREAAGNYNTYGITGFTTMVASNLTGKLLAQITITTTKTDVTCGANGSIVVEITGNTLPVTYAIKKDTDPLFGPPRAENYFYNLLPGTYVVAVYEDANITESAPVTLTSKDYVAMTVKSKVVGNAGITCCNPDGSIVITLDGGKGSPPFIYHLKGGPTSKPDIIGVGKNNLTASFTQLESGTYSIDITDACGNTINSGELSVISRYDFSNVTFGSLVMPVPAIKASDCNISIAFAKDNILLKDNQNNVIFQRSVNHMPLGFPLEARVEYPAGSGIYTDWQKVVDPFPLPNYHPAQTNVNVELRHPCNSSNIVYSSCKINAPYPYVSQAGYCNPAIIRLVDGYLCGNVDILLTKKSGSGSGVASKSYTWDGVDKSFLFDPVADNLDGTYTVDITVNGMTYRTTDITMSTGSGSIGLSTEYDYISTHNCDFTTGSIITSTAFPSDNSVPITYSVVNGPFIPDPVTSATAFPGGNSVLFVWTGLPAGTYRIRLDYGECKTDEQNVTIAPPYSGFESDELSFIPAPTNCGKFRITGKAWFLAPNGSVSTDRSYIAYCAKETSPGVYESSNFSGSGSAVSGQAFTSADLDPGNYKVIFRHGAHSANKCDYASAVKYITIPAYKALSVDVSNSGGLICSGSGRGELHVATQGGSGRSVTYRVKSVNESDFSEWKDTPDFSGLLPGEYNVEAKDACGFTAVQNVTLGAITSASYFNLSGKKVPGGQQALRCSGIDATLTLVTTGVASDIQWELPDGTASTSRTLNIPGFSVNDIGKYKVSYIGSGCLWKDSMTLNIEYVKPEFALVPNVTDCESVNITNLGLVSGSTAGLNFTYWNNNYAQNITSTASNITQSGIYHIVGENAGGCSDTSTVNVTVRRLNANAVTDILFVKERGSGDGTGRNWDNAMDGTFLAQYLRSKAVNGTKIYVAAGTYYPVAIGCEADNRGYAFELKQPNIYMRGGFDANAAGTDTTGTWNFQTNVTRLSGDIGTHGVITDNSYNVVRITNTNCTLTGFYVSAGNADGSASPNTLGAGIYGSAAMNLSNLVVENNSAKTTGGGIHAVDALKLTNVAVSNNEAISHGGGIYANAALTLIGNNNVSGNKAGRNGTAYAGNIDGGGIFANSTLTMSDALICNNNGTSRHGGGIYMKSTVDAVNLKKIQVDGNVAGKGVSGVGGGIYTATALDLSKLNSGSVSNNDVTGSGGGIHAAGVLTLNNITVNKNKASTTGGGIHAADALRLSNAVIGNNEAISLGGGIYAAAALTLSGNNNVSGNKAGWNGTGYAGNIDGGGIYANSSLTMSDVLICNNNGTSRYGGGIYMKSTVDAGSLRALQVDGNVAGKGVTGAGGGIFAAAALDLSGLNSGSVSNNDATGSGGGIHAAGILTLDNVTVDNNKASTTGGGIHAVGVLTLKNDTISNNKSGYTGTGYSATAYSGGGVYANINLELQGRMVLEGNTASGSGGAIYKNGITTFDVSKLDELTVKGNTAFNGTGGGIYTAAELNLSNLKKGNIINNTASGNGGGIFANVALLLGNSVVSGNKAGNKDGVYSATSYGGGIYANNALTLAGNMVFENDTASGSGGAIYKVAAGTFGVAGLGKLSVNNNAANLASTSATSYIGGGGIWTGISINLSSVPAVEFKNNSSKGKGGAVCAGSASVDLNFKNAVFSNNKSGYDFLTKAYTTTVFDNGGGIYAANALTLAGNMVFENNTTSGSGGAIYKNGTTEFNVLNLEELTVKENTALNGTGGGIYTAAVLDLSGVSIGNILNNTASQHGGGIYIHTNVALSLANSVVSGNKAGYKDGVYSGAFNGGGIYASNALTLAGNMVFENDTANGSGGAIYKVATGAFNVSGLKQLSVNNNAANTVSTGATSYIGGGGIWTGISLDLSRVSAAEFKNNSALGKGGAVCAGGTAVDLNFNNTVFSNNKSGYDFLTKTYNIAGFDHGGAVYAAYTLALKGNSTFKDNESGASGGAVFANNTLTVQGKLILENNTSVVDGGAVLKGATGNFDVSGLTEMSLSGNIARGNGGGIHTSALALELADVKLNIGNNTAGGSGGAIYMSNTGNFAKITLRDVTFSNNKAGWDFSTGALSTSANGYGGALYANTSLVLLGKVEFKDNAASGNGGAVWKSTASGANAVFDASELKVLNLIGNKSANGNGGAIYSTALMDFNNLVSGDFSNNSAKGSGGVIYTTAALALSGMTASDNEAEANGGAVYADNKLEIVNAATFSGNKAASGGAIYKGATGIMTIQKSTFSDNRAQTGGALTSALPSTTASAQTIINSTFSGNRAAQQGGAICFSASANGTTITYSTFNNNQTDDNTANAIYYASPGGSLNGNIVYGNGTGSEINNIAGITARYNIGRDPAFSGTGNRNLPANSGGDIFTSATGDVAVLADNGGPTLTLKIKEGGEAHNKIPFSIASGFGGLSAFDQRGESRLEAFADIGSVELVAPPCDNNPDPVVWYVDASASAGGSGTSIADRAQDLHVVLTNPCLKDGDIVKVAGGTYYSTNTVREESFTVVKGISVLGGYTSDFTETNRSINGHPTVLDGKGVSLHVVIWNAGKPGTIDGVTVRNGLANGTVTTFIFLQDVGGGVLLNNGQLTISRSRIENNTARNKGGGVYVETNASLIIENYKSSNNRSGWTGTAWDNVKPSTDVVSLEKNGGGGICALGKIELRGTAEFVNDIAGGSGGGIFKGYRNVFTATAMDTLRMTGCEAKVNGQGDYGGGGLFTTVSVDMLNAKRIELINCKAPGVNAQTGEGGGMLINNKSTGLVELKVANLIADGCVAGDDGGVLESYGETNSRIVVKNMISRNCKAGRYGGTLGVGNAVQLEGTIKIYNSTAGSNGGGISQWRVNEFGCGKLDTLIIVDNKTGGLSTGSNGGGAIWSNYSDIDLSNAKYVLIDNSTSAWEGGGIKIVSNTVGGKLTLGNTAPGSKTVISNNKSVTTGGGVHTPAAVILKGSVNITGNTSDTNGGGIYTTSTVTGTGLDTLKVTGNTATAAAGGGIFASGAIDLSALKYGEISGNAAKTNGGGIYAGNALTLTRTTLYDNKADGNGGGIYKTANAALTMTKSTLAKNRAIMGGGVYMTTGTNTIANCTFSENSATSNGGGLYAANTVKVTFSSFNGNTANGGAGSGNAVLFDNATGKTLYGNVIYGNGTSGSEISAAPATASYNIVRDMSLTGAGNVNLAAGAGNAVFKTVTGDLATLEDNGGPTKTLMIADQNQGGRAHNFIPVNTAKTFDATVTSDQRDSVRFAKCKADCGSVEIQHDIATYAFKQPWARACPYTLIDADTLIAKTANIKDTIYYSDKNYTQILAMPAKNVSRIYVKFTSLDGCVELRDTIKINLVPMPSVKVIGGKTRTICSNGFIDLNVNTTNADNVAWSGWERSGTATGANTETLHFTPVQRTSDTTFYVRATAHGNPECILAASDSVLLTLKGLPTAVIRGVSVIDTVCAGQPFSFKVKTTNSGYIEWIGGSGNLQPVRLSTSLTYAADSITFTYTPAATERGQLVNLRLKSGSGVGACGYIENDVKLFVMPQPVPAVFNLVNQPKGLQSICADTLYEVKIKSPKVGRMKDIRIGLFDENITNITVNSAEYKYPYTGATWQSLGNYALNNRNYKYTLPMPLQPNDSVIVRIHVRAGCDFTSGDVVKFTLEATDECGVTFPQQTIVSDKYTLRGDPSVANKYTFKTAYTPLTVNSRTNDTVPVRMNIVIEGTQVTDASREKIVTFIPSGLNIDPLSLKTIRNTGTVASSAVSGGTEYYMSIPSGIHPKDSVMYEFKISASDALCGTYTLRNQVYYEYEATCDAQTCPVSEIRASETANIEVKRYTFTLHSIQGETRLGKWSGDIQMNAINGFFAGDSLKVDFYVDRNSDNRYQLADDGAAVATRYVKTPVKGVDISAGGILPVQFSGIPVEPGLQLIAHSTDPLLCAPMQFPITIITGPDTTCRDKVTTITLASGMKDYHVDVISGATIVLSTTLENLPNENVRKIRWVTASGDVPVKGGYTRTILGQDMPSEKTTFVTHINPPVTAAGLKTKENVTEYCSPAKEKIYIENLKDAASMQWTASTKAGTLSGINTDTLTYSFHSRANDTTLWVRFDAKALSDCEDYKDSIRLTVYASFDAGEISSVGQAFCVGQAMPNPIGSLTGATGGNPVGGYTYRWLVNGTEIENTNTAVYTPAVVLPGTYIYTREAKDTRCNTDFIASGGTWTLTINALPIPTITGAATVCAGQNLTLTAEAYFASYVWTVVPAGNVTLNGGGTGNEETFTWSAVGTKTVTVTATDINGCEGTAITNIEVTSKADTGPIYRVPNRE